jgi:hypothetical protein
MWLLQFYAIERFLYRLSKSPHVDGVLLKGALLLQTVGIPRARPTMDIDLLRQGRADRDSLIKLVSDCALVKSDSDGVTFDPQSIVAEDIKEAAEYLGTRIQIAARMDNVRLRVQIDFGVGDVVAPGPRVIEYPASLQQPPFRLRAYPVEASVAEKFQAMVELDMANSRVKDFYDVWVYLRNLPFEGATLAEAIVATFKRRATQMPAEPPIALTTTYFDSELHLRQWQIFTRRIGEPEFMNQFAAVVADIRAFIMPVASALARGEIFAKQWPAGGPWSS